MYDLRNDVACTRLGHSFNKILEKYNEKYCSQICSQGAMKITCAKSEDIFILTLKGRKTGQKLLLNAKARNKKDE